MSRPPRRSGPIIGKAQVEGQVTSGVGEEMPGGQVEVKVEGMSAWKEAQAQPRLEGVWAPGHSEASAFPPGFTPTGREGGRGREKNMSRYFRT